MKSPWVMNSSWAMSGWRAMPPLLTYLLRVALGDRLFVAAAVLLVGSAALAAFVGSTALVEQTEFAAVCTAAAGRLVVVLTLVMFTCVHLRRAFDSSEIDWLLAQPISRRGFVLSYLTLLLLFATIASTVAGLAVVIVARPEWVAVGLWSFSLLIEASIVAAAALFFALMLRSAVTSMLACLGLYALARMLGLLSGIAAVRNHAGPLEMMLDQIMAGLVLILPRLDLLAQSSWLVHGIDDSADHITILLQGVIYLTVIGAAATFDFRRRQL